MTLKEIYAKVKKEPKPDTPAAFIKELAQVTKRSELAVRRWLGDGDSTCVPDALTRDVIARHFNTTAEELFPSAETKTA